MMMMIGERKKSCGKDFPAEKIDMPVVRGKRDSNLTDKRVGKRSRAVHRFGSNVSRSARCCHSARSGKAGWQHPPYEGIKYILQKKGKNTYTHKKRGKYGRIETKILNMTLQDGTTKEAAHRWFENHVTSRSYYHLQDCSYVHFRLLIAALVFCSPAPPCCDKPALGGWNGGKGSVFFEVIFPSDTTFPSASRQRNNREEGKKVRNWLSGYAGESFSLRCE